jgi:L-alanine-DL-glutamate epimerase-like enolase superfamily enzyme
MATYDALRDLPLEIESYALEGLQQDVSSDFVRRTTVIRLQGAGEEGVGEDVTYDGNDQIGLQEEGPTLPLEGSFTIDSFSELVGRLNLFPTGPDREDYRNYRRWAFESAALDLALRQANRPLTDVLGRSAQPVNFVVSMRLGEQPTSAPVRGILEHYPDMRFKLDATSEWSDDLIAELRELGVVDSIDLKGQYKGTVVDQPPDVDLYRRIVEGFPDAWIEDPNLTPETEPVLENARDRITWDAIIHSIADIEDLPFPPKTVNVKPSRFGSLEALCAAYDYCAEHWIGAYGGGQFELGPGRGQIQYLAAVFHPDTPNDVAPSGFNKANPGPGLPSSPLAPAYEPIGFRRADAG